MSDEPERDGQAIRSGSVFRASSLFNFCLLLFALCLLPLLRSVSRQVLIPLNATLRRVFFIFPLDCIEPLVKNLRVRFDSSQ